MRARSFSGLKKLKTAEDHRTKMCVVSSIIIHGHTCRLMSLICKDAQYSNCEMKACPLLCAVKCGCGFWCMGGPQNANSQFNSCLRKVISRMGDTEPRLLHINQDFNFRGLAVLSRNSRNINASKITCYIRYIDIPRNATALYGF